MHPAQGGNVPCPEGTVHLPSGGGNLSPQPGADVCPARGGMYLLFRAGAAYPAGGGACAPTGGTTCSGWGAWWAWVLAGHGGSSSRRRSRKGWRQGGRQERLLPERFLPKPGGSHKGLGSTDSLCSPLATRPWLASAPLMPSRRRSRAYSRWLMRRRSTPSICSGRPMPSGRPRSG